MRKIFAAIACLSCYRSIFGLIVYSYNKIIDYMSGLLLEY